MGGSDLRARWAKDPGRGGAGLAVGAASSRRQRGLEQVTRRTKSRRGVGQAAATLAELDEAVSVTLSLMRILHIFTHVESC